ncbi:hypothetical protein SAMN04487787_114134 [Kosakonia sacchari]|nr:hypothetical protein SAMN04487787_114134 [Kosakonia sacchari]
MLIQVGALSRRAGMALFQFYAGTDAQTQQTFHTAMRQEQGDMDDARSAAMATTGDRGDDAESLFRIRFTDRLMPRRD